MCGCKKKKKNNFLIFWYKHSAAPLARKSAFCSWGYPVPPQPSSSLSCSLSTPDPLLTDASRYLVMVAPGAVCLADCGRQLFGGESVAAVAEVGHPCADGVICSQHTSVHWRAGRAARHGCRPEKDNCTHVFATYGPHASRQSSSWQTQGLLRHGSSTDINGYSIFVGESHLSYQLLLQFYTAAIYYYPLKRKH